MHKIYCFNNGGTYGWMQAIAIGDDGHVLVERICTNESCMSYHLGFCSNWKHELYDAHFGANDWQLEWVQDPASHEGLNAAIALANAMSRNDKE